MVGAAGRVFGSDGRLVGSDSRELVQWLVRMAEGWFGCPCGWFGWPRASSVVGSGSRGLVRMAKGGLGWPKCSGSGSREVVQWLVWMAVWFCALHVFLLM